MLLVLGKYLLGHSLEDRIVMKIQVFYLNDDVNLLDEVNQEKILGLLFKTTIYAFILLLNC